ncbi:MAG: DUF1629 domain-containing protein [Pseudomonadota bacterium]
MTPPLPSHFLVIPYDENGRLTLEPISEMPDAIFGAGHSWMVSERFKNILEITAPGAARFDPITLKGPKNSDLPGHWFLLVFQQFANIIDEERSNLLRIYEQMANWDRPGSEQPTVLFAESSAQARYDFWSGIAPDDTSRTKAANASLTYCSDAVMQVFKENQITGFGPCFKIDLLNEDDNAQMAIGSLKDAKAKAQIEADTHQLLSCEVIHSFGPTQANPKHPPHDGQSDIELPIPVDEEFPDLWRINNYLVVSETAKSLLETLIPDDVQFAKVIPEPLQSGATYSGPQLYLLTPLKKFQPFSSELSESMRPSVAVSGAMILSLVTNPGLVIDATALGECKFWDGMPHLAGNHAYFCESGVFETMIQGGLTGFCSSGSFSSALCEY